MRVVEKLPAERGANLTVMEQGEAASTTEQETPVEMEKLESPVRAGATVSGELESLKTVATVPRAVVRTAVGGKT